MKALLPRSAAAALALALLVCVGCGDSGGCGSPQTPPPDKTAQYTGSNCGAGTRLNEQTRQCEAIR